MKSLARRVVLEGAILTSVVVVHRIPISLLELNTFGHAVCALLIYLLWWEKPFEVDFPTIIKDQILWNFCALSWMRDNASSAVKSFSVDLRECMKRSPSTVRPCHFVFAKEYCRIACSVRLRRRLMMISRFVCISPVRVITDSRRSVSPSNTTC